MRLSVLVATYNGEKYILEQLESIKKQTYFIDEVVIVDDMSEDNTVTIVENYINKYNLGDRWRISVNFKNKGYIRNFIDGMSLLTGDVVFLADQDDVWDISKIENMVNVFVDKEADAVMCLSDSIDENGKNLKDSLLKFRNIPSNENVHRVSLEERLKYGRSAGLCLAFRKKLCTEIKYIVENYDLPHDLPIGLIAAVYNRYYMINKVLVHHRVHADNVSGSCTEALQTANDFDRQIKSRTLKINELKVIQDLYHSKISIDEKKISNALDINVILKNKLENRDLCGLIRCLTVNNPLINRMLIFRNIISLFTSQILRM